MVWWETLGGKMSNCSAEKNRNTQVEHTHVSPNPLLSKERLQLRTFTLVLLRVCDVKGAGRRRRRKWEKTTIFETMSCLWICASDIVALQGHEKDDQYSVLETGLSQVGIQRGISKDERFSFRTHKAPSSCGSHCERLDFQFHAPHHFLCSSPRYVVENVLRHARWVAARTTDSLYHALENREAGQVS